MNCHPCDWNRPAKDGGEAGIRTLDTAFGPYNGLANRRLQPLGHLTARGQASIAALLASFESPATYCLRGADGAG